MSNLTDEQYKGNLISSLDALVSANLETGKPNNIILTENSENQESTAISDKFNVEEVTFVIPAPFRAWCHICKTGFMTINDLTEHTKEQHRIYKG